MTVSSSSDIDFFHSSALSISSNDVTSYLRNLMGEDGLKIIKDAARRGQLNYLVSLQGMSHLLHLIDEFGTQLHENPSINLDQMNSEIAANNAETLAHVTEALIPFSYYNPVTMLKRKYFQDAFKRDVLENPQHVDHFSSFFNSSENSPNYRQWLFSKMLCQASQHLNDQENTAMQEKTAEQIIHQAERLTDKLVLGTWLNNLLKQAQIDSRSLLSLHQQIVRDGILPSLRT